MFAITGYSGLVGRYLCDALVSNCIPFKLLGRNPIHDPPYDTAPFCFYDLSVTSSEKLHSFLDDVDVFINLAALLPNNHSGIGDYFSCNAFAPKFLFDVCSEVGVDKFIHASSANLLRPSDGVVTSDSTYSFELRQPSYLSSKIAGELLLMNSPGKTNLFIVRPSSIYGFGMRNGFCRHVYDSFLQSKSVRLVQNGLWSADFIYAGDVAECILGLVDNVTPGIFNLGSGCVSTMHSVAQSFASLAGVDEDLIVLEPFEDDSPAVGSLPAVCSDQVISLLGRSPLLFDQGLNHAILTYGSF